ncbi:TPA: hypothetical protein H1009_00095 [archaeon]|nr:hypothetical protein [Candidatus Naiadarchaeales archaeon SRR2090153.bin461]
MKKKSKEEIIESSIADSKNKDTQPDVPLKLIVNGKRLDGRRPDEIRPIKINSCLPKKTNLNS